MSTTSAVEQEGSTRRVVVVGGGIAGVAFFIAAIRFKTATRIDIIDPGGIGCGVAFSTTESALLNEFYASSVSFFFVTRPMRLYLPIFVAFLASPVIPGTL